jgi:aryl-alcohol dehydrogenase-like predicted oxidoreductase
VSSKVFFGAVANPKPTQCGLSRKHIVDACHAALKRLRVDYLDLYFCHRPDPETPVDEIVSSMDLLIRQGKVLYWGTSEWPASLIDEAAQFARAHHLFAPQMEQTQYNLLHRSRIEHEYQNLFDQTGIGCTAWSPLASGLLTGKYRDVVPEGSRLALEQYAWLKSSVLELGSAHRQSLDWFCDQALQWGMTPAQLAIAWCTTNAHISTVILGATNGNQLRENLLCLEQMESLPAGWKETLNQRFALH